MAAMSYGMRSLSAVRHDEPRLKPCTQLPPSTVLKEVWARMLSSNLKEHPKCVKQIDWGGGVCDMGGISITDMLFMTKIQLLSFFSHVIFL